MSEPLSGAFVAISLRENGRATCRVILSIKVLQTLMEPVSGRYLSRAGHVRRPVDLALHWGFGMKFKLSSACQGAEKNVVLSTLKYKYLTVYDLTSIYEAYVFE